MGLIKIEKTNKKTFEGPIEKAGKHYYVYFTCDKCGATSKKQIRRFDNDFSNFLCGNCLKNGYKHSIETKRKIGTASKKNNNIKLMQKTMVKEYGVDNASYLKDSIRKRQLTKRKYLYPFLVDRIKLEGYDCLFDINEYVGQRIENNNIQYKFKHNKCNTEFLGTLNGHLPRCPKCYPISSSKGEKDISSFIKSLNITVVENSRDIISPLELDIYLPDYNIAIEYNGLYWHSDRNGKDRKYHLNKTNLCNENNISLIHIFEDEWINKKDIVKSVIKSKLNIFDKTIYGRKTVIKEVSLKERREFLNDNHLQGDINSRLNYGLYYDNELVSLMTFGKSRFNKNYEYELLRFCNKLNYKVVGGASKLLKYFKSNIDTNLISYCDLRYFDGAMYLKLGFKLDHISDVNYYYTDYVNRYNRMKFQKYKLKNLLEYFDENLTGYENMIINGYDRIYDCGNKVFVM